MMTRDKKETWGLHICSFERLILKPAFARNGKEGTNGCKNSPSECEMLIKSHQHIVPPMKSLVACDCKCIVDSYK